MKLAEACSFFGAYRACIGISDAVILLHSVVGCHFGTLLFHQARHPEDVRQASTVVYEDEAIYGGTDTLVKALKNADEVYPAAKLFIVLSGCVPNMIGDDVDAAIEAAALERPVLNLMMPGLSGDMCTGYEDALVCLGKYMRTQGKVPRRINLIGLSADDFLADGDVAALRDLLEPQVQIGTVVGIGSFAQLRQAPTAALNIVFGQGEPLAQYMQEQFDTPYIIAAYPYGVYGAALFLRQVAAALPGVSYEDKIAQMNAQVQPNLARMSYYLQRLYGMPAAVLGDAVRTEGLCAFLSEELGMDVIVCHAGGRADLNEVYARMEEAGIPLVFGSSFDLGWCEQHQATLIRVFYPVFDEIAFRMRTYVGIDGFYTLMETIVNSLQQSSLGRTRIYAGLSLCEGVADV